MAWAIELIVEMIEKWSNLEHILQIEVTRLTVALNVAYKEKKEVKDDS